MEMVPQHNPLLGPEVVASILGLSVKTVHRLARAGIIQCVKVTDRRRMFTEEQVQTFIEKRSTKGPRPLDESTPSSLPYMPKSRKEGEHGKRIPDIAQLKKELRSW